MAKIKCTCVPKTIERFGVEKPKGMDFEYINYPCSDEELIEACKDADILFCGPVDFIRKNVIDQLPNLKLIQSQGVGFDKIDLEATKARGIYVCNNRAVNALSVAEHAVGMMLACLKRTCEADSMIKAGKFPESFQSYKIKGHCELGTRTVGLIGLGAIGKAAVKMLDAFGCKILYADVFRADEAFEKQYNLEYCTYEELYERCDILSYHVPVLPETTGMINKETIGKMKKDAIIINVARGEIVNNEDLKEALENELVYAGLDVIAPEPPAPDHPMFVMNETGKARLTITPHIAGTTDDAFTRMSQWAYDNMIKVMNGDRPNNIVNGL